MYGDNGIITSDENAAHNVGEAKADTEEMTTESLEDMHKSSDTGHVPIEDIAQSNQDPFKDIESLYSDDKGADDIDSIMLGNTKLPDSRRILEEVAKEEENEDSELSELAEKKMVAKVTSVLGTRATGFDSMVTSEDNNPMFKPGNEKDYMLNPPGLPAVKTAKPKIKGNNASGAVKKSLITTTLGLADKLSIPLYNSGFKILLGSIPSTEVITLTKLIVESVDEVGAQTAGLAFTNRRTVTDDIILDFVVEHIEKTNIIGLENIRDVRKYISYHDIPIITMSILKAVTMNDVTIAIPCTNSLDNDKECTYVGTAKVDIKDLKRIAKDKFTPYMKEIINRTGSGVSIEELGKYKMEFAKPKTYSIDGINGTVDITLEVPSAHYATEHGIGWKSRIEEAIDKLIDADGRYTKATAMQKIDSLTSITTRGMYITKMSIGDIVITEREGDDGIDAILEELSGYESIANQINEAIDDYVSMTLLSVIGYPIFTCPKCKGEIAKDGPTGFRDLVTISDTSLFIYLKNR